MKRAAELVVLVVAAALMVGAVWLVLQQTCRPKPTPVEQHVDSTLAEVPAWQDTVRARDSVLALRDQEAAALRRQRVKDHARAMQAAATADSAQHVADSLAAIVEGTASDSVNQLAMALEAQKRAAAKFQLESGALKSELLTADRQLAQADESREQERHDKLDAYRRLDKVTEDLRKLREETKYKGKWNVLGLHLPGAAKPIASALAGAGLVCAATC